MISIKKLINPKTVTILFLEGILDFEGMANILGLGINLQTLLILQVTVTSILKPISGETLKITGR